MLSTGVFVGFVIIAQLQFWSSSNALAQDKAEQAAAQNWDLQLKVTEGEINKFVVCVDSVGTRDDFRRFGVNIFNLIDSLLIESNAPQVPFLDRAAESRRAFEEDFKEKSITDCPLPKTPVKPDDVPVNYNPPIPTIPDEYLQKLMDAKTEGS